MFGCNTCPARLLANGCGQIAKPLSLAIGIGNNARAKATLLKLKRNRLANLKGRLLNARTNRNAHIAHVRASGGKFTQSRWNYFIHHSPPTRMHRGHNARVNIRDQNWNTICNTNGERMTGVPGKNGVALHKWRRVANHVGLMIRLQYSATMHLRGAHKLTITHSNRTQKASPIFIHTLPLIRFTRRVGNSQIQAVKGRRTDAANARAERVRKSRGMQQWRTQPRDSVGGFNQP